MTSFSIGKWLLKTGHLLQNTDCCTLHTHGCLSVLGLAYYAHFPLSFSVLAGYCVTNFCPYVSCFTGQIPSFHNLGRLAVLWVFFLYATLYLLKIMFGQSTWNGLLVDLQHLQAVDAPCINTWKIFCCAKARLGALLNICLEESLPVYKITEWMGFHNYVLNLPGNNKTVEKSRYSCILNKNVKYFVHLLGYQKLMV